MEHFGTAVFSRAVSFREYSRKVKGVSRYEREITIRSIF